MTLISHRGFRNEVLRILARLYSTQSTADHFGVCQCFIFLDDAQAASDVVVKLLKNKNVLPQHFLFTPFSTHLWSSVVCRPVLRLSLCRCPCVAVSVSLAASFVSALPPALLPSVRSENGPF